MRRRLCFAAIAFGWLVSCGEDSGPATAANDPAEAIAANDPPRAASHGGDPVTVWFDLARHLPRAEIQRGDTLLIDLGVAGGHKYTLGRWRTRVGVDHRFDEVSASVIEDVTGFFLLPIPSASHCALTLRARSFADRRVTLYLDDQTLANLSLGTDGEFDTVEVTIPPALCTPGEHELRFRVPATGRADGLSGLGVAVDWVSLATASEGEPSEEGPPSPEALSPREGILRIPDRHRLDYAFEVPEGARLDARIAGEGRVVVSVERDELPATILATAAATAEESALHLDLSPFEGTVVRLGLAVEGDVTIAQPHVVIPQRREPAAARRMQNVLIYLTDTLRADHLHPYDSTSRVETPGLDGWARHAATILSGHAQENWTKPSCATLLSGLFPWEHHATGEDSLVPDSVELLSEHLRAQRFHTGAFVANGFVSDRFGFRQGWSTFHNYVREGRRNMARFVAEDVVAWLDERPTDRPFFLYVHTIDPHVPYIPPADDLARYDPDPYEGIVDFNRNRTLLEGVKSGQIPLDDRDRFHLEALYDAEITYHDRYFAIMMEALERRGLSDDTLVVFTSDHGEEFFDHGSVGHGHSVFEELIHVPLLVRWPGVTDAGRPVEEAVGLVDMMPTVLDALELPVPANLSGRSIAPLLRGATDDAPRATVTGFMEGWRTVVIGHRKLIHRTSDHFEVYDLAADPGETRDRAATHPIEVRYLRGLLGLSLAEVREGDHEARRTDIDATLRAQLEALGYAGASRAPTSPSEE